MNKRKVVKSKSSVMAVKKPTMLKKGLNKVKVVKKPTMLKKGLNPDTKVNKNPSKL